MDVKDLIDDDELKAIVKKSLRESLGSQRLTEAYVSEPKSYTQVSEFVSQKTKDGHKKLYDAYVDTSNRVSSELDSVSRSLDDLSSAHSDFRSLKRDETMNLNAKWLHELYFANCFDPNSEIYMDSIAFMKLQRDFGDFESWQKDMIACAMVAGDGWAVTGYNTHLQRYVNTVIVNHSHDVMLGLYPVICIDMHEHAYYRDYTTDKHGYLVAMMREINWRVVEERINRAEAIAKALR